MALPGQPPAKLVGCLRALSCFGLPLLLDSFGSDNKPLTHAVLRLSAKSGRKRIQ